MSYKQYLDDKKFGFDSQRKPVLLGACDLRGYTLDGTDKPPEQVDAMRFNNTEFSIEQTHLNKAIKMFEKTMDIKTKVQHDKDLAKITNRFNRLHADKKHLKLKEAANIEARLYNYKKV